MPTFAYRAKSAMSGANVTEDHERRRSFAPAFEDIRATSLLTDRMQAQVVYHPIYAIKCFIGTDLYLEPIGSRAGKFRFSHRSL